MPTFKSSVDLSVPVETAFAYHSRRGALQRLTPPWESVSVQHNDHSLAVGSRVVLKTKVFGVPVRWVAQHTRLDPPHLFADTQLSGPFARWDHLHQFTACDHATSRLTDEIQYRLPGGRLGQIFGGAVARRTVQSMFAYRHRVTADDLQLLNDHRDLRPLRIAISGSTGLVGDHFTTLARLLGHTCIRLVRDRDSLRGDGRATHDRDETVAPWAGDDQVSRLEGVDAVVHLAGKSIADRRWNAAVKQEILDSRIELTDQLCRNLAKLDRKPNVLVCASATGIYGDRGDEVLTEHSSIGDDFLADVGCRWEAACRPAVEAGIRVVHVRFGIVLSPQGGALAKMLLPAKLLGGRLGAGRQWWSWVSIDDCTAAIYHLIARDDLSGPFNIVSPDPVRNADFAATLGRVLGRPALFPAPAAALRAALGEMADALLLSSARVMPQRLLESGYRFRFTDLGDALAHLLGKAPR